MENKRGISLIALVITIVVIIILAGAIIGSSFRDTIESSTMTRKISEMTEVYDAVIQRGIENKIDDDMYPYIGTKLTNENPREVNGVVYGDGFYYIETAEQKEALHLERVVDAYIANYETGEIISLSKIEYEGKECYTLADISSAVQGIDTTINVGQYDENGGVNKPVLSEGMVPVKEEGKKEEGNKWVVTTEDDSNWYDYANGKYATIMLMDELTLLNKSNEEIRKMSRSQLNSLSGNEVLIQGSTFIWIPRYTYKEEDGEIKIMYSHLTEDYTGDGYIKSPAFYFGSYVGAQSDIDANTGYVGGGKELTGIWVSKYEAGFNF